MKSWRCVLSIALVGCSSIAEPTLEPAVEAGPVERGRYLVDLLGCGSCHTEGQLFDRPRSDRFLAGSSTGIGYTNDTNPGVVFPANLTPDRETGLGARSPEDIKNAIRFGMDKHGRQRLPIMPWPRYQTMSDADAGAIVSYLASLPAIKNEVPGNVPPNTPSTATYVRFGVYLFVPNEEARRTSPN